MLAYRASRRRPRSTSPSALGRASCELQVTGPHRGRNTRAPLSTPPTPEACLPVVWQVPCGRLQNELRPRPRLGSNQAMTHSFRPPRAPTPEGLRSRHPTWGELTQHAHTIGVAGLAIFGLDVLDVPLGARYAEAAHMHRVPSIPKQVTRVTQEARSPRRGFQPSPPLRRAWRAPPCRPRRRCRRYLTLRRSGRAGLGVEALQGFGVVLWGRAPHCEGTLWIL